MTKYEKHFGLNKPPFAVHAAGTDVFVAPQVATAIAGLQKALATEDAIVCLSGAVGAGKTTIAKRALDGIGTNRAIVTIGRMVFGHDEVLELLLAGLGARQLPKSTVHRFATLRRILQHFSEQDVRVFILIEDAIRVGFDALSELEALTAADAGVSNGANLILLGDERLGELILDPKLARIKQRIRSRQTVAAQSETEMLGYLKHSFRLAGREFDTIFEDGSLAALHRLSDGVPRVVNNLLESVLVAAAEAGTDKISSQLIERIAAEEFGLTGEHRVADFEAIIEQADAVASPEPESELEPEPAPVPEPEIEDIPELIQDTLPALAILAPELAAAAAAEFEQEPTLVPEILPQSQSEPETVAQLKAEPEFEFDSAFDDLDDVELPTLSSSMRLDVSPAPAPVLSAPEPENDIPAWDRDPTLAQLRPDLEALARAMAVAQGTDAKSAVVATALEQNTDIQPQAETISKHEAKSEPEPMENIPKIFPEITLDKQITAKIAEVTEARKQTQMDATAELRDDSDASNDDFSDPAITSPEVEDSKHVSAPPERPISNIDIPAKSLKDAEIADQELEKTASGLAKAKTVEDVEDHLAETLFGEEFSMLASQIAANTPLQSDTEVASATPAGETMGSTALSRDPEAIGETEADALDTSASQRLQVLRYINQTAPPPGAPPSPDVSETIVMSGDWLHSPRSAAPISVNSIENQITTSMTQTLKALNINSEPKSDRYDDDDEEEENKGFFSRFRKK
jgi:general secretion pathway protein A